MKSEVQVVGIALLIVVPLILIWGAWYYVFNPLIEKKKEQQKNYNQALHSICYNCSCFSKYWLLILLCKRLLEIDSIYTFSWFLLLD